MSTLFTTAIFNCFKTRAKAFDDIKMRGNWQHHYGQKEHGDDLKTIGNESYREGNAVNENKEEFFICR